MTRGGGPPWPPPPSDEERTLKTCGYRRVVIRDVRAALVAAPPVRSPWGGYMRGSRRALWSAHRVESDRRGTRAYRHEGRGATEGAPLRRWILIAKDLDTKDLDTMDLVGDASRWRRARMMPAHAGPSSLSWPHTRWHRERRSWTRLWAVRTGWIQQRAPDCSSAPCRILSDAPQAKTGRHDPIGHILSSPFSSTTTGLTAGVVTVGMVTVAVPFGRLPWPVSFRINPSRSIPEALLSISGIVAISSVT